VVQYHFGDRESLVREIIAYRAALSEQIRVEMFADLLARGQPQVSDLVRIFMFPLAAHLEGRSHYLAFMSRFITERGGYTGLDASTGIPAATVSTLRTLLSRLLPDYPDEVLGERWMVAMTSTIHTLARYQAATISGTGLGSPIGVLLEDLVRFLTAGIEAPIGSAPSKVEGPAAITRRSPAAGPGKSSATSSRGKASGSGNPPD
jgi:AcrR family transcriptional regulator